MLKRWKACAHAWLIALDQFAYVTLAWPKCWIVGGPVPSPYETISSKTGRMAAAGHRWARLAQAMIDRLFVCLGSPPGHCQRSIVKAATIEASLRIAEVIQ
jgi:hypothetical protein